jgi:hypothetical protein
MPFQPPTIEFEILDGGLSAGTTAPPDGPLWVLGPAESGPFTPFPASQANDVKATFTHGAGVEGTLYALNNEVSSATFLRVDPTDGADGAYGAITVEAQGAGFTATGDGTVLPGDDWEPLIDFTVGGTIGVSGIRYTYSLDNGQKVSGERDLGTDSFISLPFGGGKYNLVGLELTSLLARLVEIRTDFLGHAAEFGAYHTVVDPNSPYTITVPTNDATILTCCSDLKTAALNHVDEVGTVHAVADATATAALTALVVPATRAQAIVFAEAFAAAFFGTGTANSGHSIRTTSLIHITADVTNVLTSDPAVAGDIVAGDFFYGSNTGPRWSIDKLVEAIGKVKDSTSPCNGVLEIVGPVLTNGEAQAIEDALEALGEKYRDVRAIGHWRARNAGESHQAYAAAFELAHPLASATGRKGRLALMASYYPPSQLVPGAASVRPKSFAMAPRLARLPISTNAISEVDCGTFKGALRAANGLDVLPRAVDETFAPVCTPVRLWAFRSDPSGILSSRPVTLAPDGSDFALIHYGRVIDAVKKSAYRSLKRRMGQKVAPKAGTVLIDPNEAKRIGEAETKKLTTEFVDKGQINGVRVVVRLDSVVSGAGTKITYVDIFVRPVGYIEDIRVTLQFAL